MVTDTSDRDCLDAAGHRGAGLPDETALADVDHTGSGIPVIRSAARMPPVYHAGEFF